jgi:hypothetical protein
MATPPRTWLTPEMVATYLGDASLATEPNLIAAVGGVAAYLEDRRSDLFYPLVPALRGRRERLELLERLEGHPITRADLLEVEVIVPEDMVLGATMWAAHVYQLRSSPSGYASYGDGAGDAMGDLSLASNRGDIYRLTGIKRPVAY